VSRRGWWVALVAVAAVHLAVPLVMIGGHERTLREGTAWRFPTAPVDPADAFRGRYVALTFPQAETQLAAGFAPERGDWVYVPLARDSDGFARLGSALPAPPDDGDYLRVRARWTVDGDTRRVGLAFPFDRLYMEESVAPRAEEVYRQLQPAPGATAAPPAWAVVRVRDGRAALEDVSIDGTSLRELARRRAAAGAG
jgi:hypothetical protein